GNGNATEAVRAFLPVMEETLGIGTVYVICLTENAASRHVLDKCGFETVSEGTGDYQGEQREVYKSVWRKA
ncbi:MAG: GNAT family N-acetyltransferase, partial [Clostridia bacterium]|nr:GNAT family N-acetyltransferase [Clostridia bacterium]